MSKQWRYRYSEKMRQLRKKAAQMKNQDQLSACLLIVRDIEDRKALFLEMAPHVKFDSPICPLDIHA